MIECLTADELARLVQRVFRPRADDRAIAVIVDLPDGAVEDHAAWRERRSIAAGWVDALRSARASLGIEAVELVTFRNARRNNAPLPDSALVQGEDIRFDELFRRYSILLAPTEFSATAPLKVAAREHGFRAASMPGFCAEMIPALRLDYEDVDRRCRQLAELLDAATSARLVFDVAGRERILTIDLRHRTAIPSGGVLHEPGVAGNLPSGETYIVPYEGERPEDPSRTAGVLPLELEGELIDYRIEGNRVVRVDGDGPHAAAEREEVANEPAYANIAELGLGVLGDYGIEPIGELLLDEKLGLHIAFGRSDHFGGTIGPDDFSAPDRVIHLDRVYIPQVQPSVVVRSVELALPGGEEAPRQAGTAWKTLIRDGRYRV